MIFALNPSQTIPWINPQGQEDEGRFRPAGLMFLQNTNLVDSTNMQHTPPECLTAFRLSKALQDSLNEILRGFGLLRCSATNLPRVAITVHAADFVCGPAERIAGN
jgi:hypothetical protein